MFALNKQESSFLISYDKIIAKLHYKIITKVFISQAETADSKM